MRSKFISILLICLGILLSQNGYAVTNEQIINSYNLGIDAYKKADYKNAAANFLVAAKLNNPNAQFNLAAMYFNGDGVEKNYLEASKWFALVADRADAKPDLIKNAEYSLGAISQKGGYGLRIDLPTAAQWYRLASDKGDARAQYELGEMLISGYGVSKNNNEALKLITLSAKQNNPSAQFALGRLYGRGDIVERDYITSYKWFYIAFSSKDASISKNARQGIIEISQKMTRAQIEEAKKLAEECKDFKFKNCDNYVMKVEVK
jgi:TPR repeat protein